MLTTRARPEQERSSRKLKSESRLYRFLTRSRSRSRSNNDDTLPMDKKQKAKQPKQTASLGRSTRPPVNLNSPPSSKPRTRVQSRPLSSSTSATNTTITPAPTTPKAKRRLTTGAPAVSQPSPPRVSSNSKPPLSHSRSTSNSNSNSNSHSRPPTSDSTNSKRKRRFQDLFGGLSLGSLSRSRSRSGSRPPSPSPARGSFDVHRHPLPKTPGSYSNHYDHDGEGLEEEDIRDERRYQDEDEEDERVEMDDKTPQPSRFLSVSATTPHGSYSRQRHSHGRSPSPSPAPSPLPAVPLRGYLSLDHREHEGEDDLEDDPVHGLQSSRQVPVEEEELESTYDVDITPKMLRVTNPGTMYSVTTTTNSEAGEVESVRGAMARNPHRTSSTPSGGPPPYSYFSFDPNNSPGSSGPSTPPTHSPKLPSKLSESLMLTHEKRASDTSAIANVTINRISGPFHYQHQQRRSMKDADLPPLPSPPLPSPPPPLQSHSANGSQSSLHAHSPKLVGVPLKYTADQLLNANGLPIPAVGIGSSKTRSFGHVHAMKGSLDSSYRYRMNGKERMGVVDEADDGQEVEVYGKESHLETPNSASGHSYHSSQSHSHSNHSSAGLGVNAKGKSRESTETHSLSHLRAQTMGLPSPRHSGTGRSSKHGSFDFERPLGYLDIQRSGSGENVASKEKGRESESGPGFAGVGTLQREVSERRLKDREERDKRKDKGKERDLGVKGVHTHGHSHSNSHSHAHSTRTTPSEGHAQSHSQTLTTTAAHGKHSSMSKATARRTAAAHTHTSSAHGHGHNSSHGHPTARASSKLAGGTGIAMGGLAGIGKPHHGLFSFEPPVRSIPPTTASVGSNGVSTANGRSSGNALSTGSALSGSGDTTIRVGRVKSGGGVSGISGLSGGMSAVEWKTEREYERVQKEKERQREKDRERKKGAREGKAVPVPISSVGGPISISVPGALRGTANGVTTPGGERREGRPLTTSMTKANDYLSGILSGSWTAPSFLNRASKVFDSKDKEKDKDKPLPSLLPVFSPPPKENTNIGHRSGTKGRSLDLGLGLAWASSKVPEEALLPRSTFMARAVSGDRDRERSRDRERPRHNGLEKGYGWSQGRKESVGSVESAYAGRHTQLNGGDEHVEEDIDTSRLGKQIAEVFRNALDDQGYKSFKSYVRQFDAHEIPFDGPTGIVTVVEHLLASAPHLSAEGKKRLLDRFVKIIFQQS